MGVNNHSTRKVSPGIMVMCSGTFQEFATEKHKQTEP